MKKLMVAALAMGVTGFLGFSGTVYADNITIFDGTSDGTGWYGTQEDNEVEPGMVYNQSWDLEGFFLEGTELSMVGGFNFIGGNGGIHSGDIFIDTDGQYGRNYGPESTDDGVNTIVDSTFGYEYVFDIDFAGETYHLRDLTADNENEFTVDVSVAQNGNNTPIGSNPWRYSHNSNSEENIMATGTYSFASGLTNGDTGFLGGSHYSLTGFDLSPIIADMGGGPLTFTSHFTMGCGNDNLMGQGTTPVPEPGMLLLVGTAFAGLVNIRRKRIKRA